MDRIAAPETVGARSLAGGGGEKLLVPPAEGSELSLSLVRLPSGGALAVGEGERDTLLFVTGGAAGLSQSGRRYELGAGCAALLARGEEGAVAAGVDGISFVRALVGSGGHVHAPMGPRETVTRLDQAGAAGATGSRSFQTLFGPHNGSLLATLFVGYIPPGAAPVHYHLYDEIVCVLDGRGRLHLGAECGDLPPGSAFRLHARERHVVENAGEGELAVLGIFAPAGSPAAAYLERAEIPLPEGETSDAAGRSQR